MIKYTLTCPNDHRFDSWFSSSADFDRLSAGGHLSCAICGSAGVAKALMTPNVAANDGIPAAEASAETGAAAPADPAPLSSPATPAEQALRELREKIERDSEDVGRKFATEARAIHDGAAPARSIYGEAKPEEAKKLLEDGIPVAPLPFRIGRKDS